MGKYPPWVVLAYLNGNNELAPEISAAQYDIEETTPGIDTEILLQIGRLDKNIVKILRPNEKTDEKDSWHGVRLYHISRAASSLKGELANLNMADPKSLYNFIEWGMQNYPAEHYMLILSGHSCEYIGMMNDYSQDKPYIMGIPEIALVLEYIKKNLGRSIDLLIFDTCLFNNIELLYEFGQSPDPAVKTILTYRDNAPAGGLSYNEILKSMDYEGENLNSFIQNLINNSSKDLIAYNINQTSLDNIKKLFDNLARKYLEETEKSKKDLLVSMKTAEPEKPGQEILNEIINFISSLIIHKKTPFKHPAEQIRILDKYIPNKNTAAFYYRLAFARDNAWSNLLCRKLPESNFQLTISIGFSPLILAPSKIKALIASSNPNLATKDVDNILKDLILAKKWHV